MFSGMFKTGIGGICGTVGNIKSHCAHMDVFLIFHIQAHFAFLSSLVHISVNDSDYILILKTTFMPHFLSHMYTHSFQEVQDQVHLLVLSCHKLIKAKVVKSYPH